VTARTVQGMARVRSEQAPAWPLITDRRRRRGFEVKGGQRPFPWGSAKRPGRWRGAAAQSAGHPRTRPQPGFSHRPTL